MRFVVLLSIIVSNLLYANTDSFQASYEHGARLAATQQGKVASSLQQFNPSSVFHDFTAHPKESNYYQKDSLLKSKASDESKNNPMAITLKDNFNNRPQFKIASQSVNMKTSLWMLEHANDVIRGQSCKKIPICETIYETKTCQEQASIRWHFCQKRLQVNVDNQVHETHYPIILHLKSDRYYMGARINVVTGRLIDHGPHDSTAWIDGRLPVNLDCNTLHSTITKTSIDRRFIDGISYPTCGNLDINIHVTDPNHRHRINGTIEIDIVSRRVDTHIQDTWEDGCEILSKLCKLDYQQCTQGNETRVIGGVAITRNCWVYDAKYTCSAQGSIPNTCQPLKEQGCEQISSVCHTQENNQCVLYDQTFRCPIKTCSSQEQTLCVKEPACINGDCSEHSKVNDPDFSRAAGSFGAMVDAAKQLNKNNQFIFQGHESSCSKAPVGFLDCCADSGWGKEMFEKCSEQEKKLKTGKDNHLVVAIPGEYCTNEVGGICLSKRKRYCVFTTKLARLIQEKGRRDQLHISFGTPDEPNCTGIAPEELQKIDFSTIDFSEIAEDIKHTMPARDQEVLIHRMKQRVDELRENG